MDFWVVLGFFGAFVGGIITTLLFFRMVKRQAFLNMQAEKSIKGTQARQDQAEELVTFLGEVKIAFDASKAAGKDIKSFAMIDLPPIALRHPALMLRFGSRLMKLVGGEGGIPELADLSKLMAA